MGMDIRIEIGPYIEVIGKATISTVKVKRICPNHPGQKQDNAKFCPTCGTEIQNVDYTETKALDPLAVLWRADGFEDSFWSPEGMEDILLPTDNVPKQFKCDAEYGGTVDLRLSENRMNDQIQWMEETYKTELAFLIQNFGRENVSVKWGVISYWS